MGIQSHLQTVAVLLVLSSLAAVPVAAQDCHDYSDHARWVGSFYAPEPGYGDPFGFFDIAYHEGRLYALTLWSGLYELDFSNPAELQLGRELWFDYGAQDFVFWGDYVYVSGYWYGVRILRIEPDGFVEVGLLYRPYPIGELAVADGRLYMRAQGGIRIYDLLPDPENPWFARQVDLSSSGRAIAVTDGSIYATMSEWHRDCTLVVMSSATPEPVLQSGAVFIEGYGLSSVHVHNGVAYVTGGTAELVGVDVRDPSRPTIRRFWNLPAYANAVAVTGPHAFLCAGDLLVVDLATPEAAQEDRWYRLPAPNQGACKLTTVGDHVFIAEAGDQIAGMNRVGVQVYQVGTRESPPGPWTSLDIGDPGETPTDIAVCGDLACVLTDEEIYLLSLSEEGESEVVGSTSLGVTDAVTWAVACDGDLVLAALSEPEPARLIVFDVGDPTQPEVICALELTGSPMDVVIDGTRAYVVTHGGELIVVALDDLQAPTILSITPSIWHISVAVAGDLVAVASYHCGVQLYDVSDPIAPALVGEIDTLDSARCVRLDSNVLHVADRRLYVSIDVSDPANPVLLGSHDLAHPADDLVVTDGMVYLTGKDAAGIAGNCLQIIDATDPTAPRHLGHTAFHGAGYSAVTAVAGWIVAAAGGGGVHVFAPQCEAPDPAKIVAGVRTPDPIPESSLRVAPNPANPRCEITFELPEASPIHLEIFDAAGRLVKRLANGPFPAGFSRVIWDGADAAGQPMASGVYLVRVRSTAGDLARKITLVR